MKKIIYGIILLILTLDIMAKRKSIFIYIVILGLLGFSLNDSKEQFETAKSNTKEFNKGKTDE